MQKALCDEEDSATGPRDIQQVLTPTDIFDHLRNI